METMLSLRLAIFWIGEVGLRMGLRSGERMLGGEEKGKEDEERLVGK